MDTSSHHEHPDRIQIYLLLPTSAHSMMGCLTDREFTWLFIEKVYKKCKSEKGLQGPNWGMFIKA